MHSHHDYVRCDDGGIVVGYLLLRADGLGPLAPTHYCTMHNLHHIREEGKEHGLIAVD